MLALVSVALVGAGPASATEVSTDELRSLARRALVDPEALERLRDVERVAGRPVDIAAALGGARGADLESRLRTLSSGAAPAPARSDVTEQAQEIVDSPPYTDRQLPRPFRGVLRWLGERLEPVLDAVARPFTWLSDRTPGGWTTIWALVGAVIVLAAALVTASVLRRSRVSAAQRRVSARREDLDPRRIEREASEAESRGDLERAIRLRFIAGLLRLDEAGTIEFSPSLTTGEVARLVRLAPFRDLGRVHDEIVYGRRPATTSDLESSRHAWARVLETAKAT